MKDSELRSTLDDLRAALADLAARVARLEAPASHAVAAPPSAPPAVGPDAGERPVAPAHAAQEIPEHVVLALSAAVAAFLGERAHIRTIRLIRSAAWAQQGRVSIQASHRLRR